MNSKLPRVILLILTSIIGGLVIMFIALSKPKEVDPTKFRVLSIDAYFSEAKAIALEWESDAYLAYVSSTFTLPHDEAESLLISYHFRSRLSPGKWLNVFCVAANPVQIEVSEGEYSEGNERPLTQEIEIDKLSIDSLDAIIIAYENGGNDFIRRNRGVDPDSFVELQQENEALGTGSLVWIITFSTDRFTTMYITLDSMTGEVLDIWRNDE